MRKIFIDCGGYDGASIRKFKSENKDFDSWETFSFEANRLCWDCWPVEGRDVIKKAVWIYDGHVEFYNKGPRSSSSTLNKKKGIGGVKEKVECIDLSKWIMNNFSKDDYIFLKMDIECAEYEILDKMLEDDSMSYIKKIRGEFHNRKCQIDKSVDEKFMKILKENYNLEWKDWSAESFYNINLNKKKNKLNKTKKNKKK